MIDVMLPLLIEKNMTPMTIIKMQIIRSVVLFPLISPYPTVVIVVTVKYKAVTYN